MRYGIINNDKRFLIIDNDKEKLEYTIEIFMPQYNKADIKEFMDTEIEEYKDGFTYIKGFAPIPTKEQVEADRKALYTVEVDPITAQIQRLKDEEQTEAVLAEIETLKAERTLIVNKIKETNPYPLEDKVNVL